MMARKRIVRTSQSDLNSEINFVTEGRVNRVKHCGRATPDDLKKVCWGVLHWSGSNFDKFIGVPFDTEYGKLTIIEHIRVYTWKVKLGRRITEMESQVIASAVNIQLYKDGKLG